MKNCTKVFNKCVVLMFKLQYLRTLHETYLLLKISSIIRILDSKWSDECLYNIHFKMMCFYLFLSSPSGAGKQLSFPISASYLKEK